MKSIARFAGWLVVAGLVACGGGSDDPAPPPPPVPDTTAPSVPTNLVANPASPTSVQLSWSASTDTGGSGLAGYRVFRNGSTTALASVTTTSYTDATAAASTTYSYQVSAYDNANPANVSALSAAATATTPATATSGLDTRPDNTSCVAGAEPTSTLAATRVFANLSFTAPIKMLQAPNDASRWYVVQQNGQIRVFPNQSGATAGQVTDFYTRSVYFSGESGLLGMAFHPQYPTDPRVFIFYINQSPHESRVAVLRLNAGGTALDAGSEQILLRAARSQTNHNGGDIAFGPDGLLYIGTGDGGGGGDGFGAIGNGQNLQTVLGKMLRVDVGASSSNSYTIPATNPYASTGGSCTTGTTTSPQCREIYAFGFRNPWRWSFDRANGELWVADVGQGSYEEVNKVVLGGNYGWRCREGAHDFNSANCGSLQPRLDPVAEYGRSAGISITGGFVYRGSAIPSLVGRYVFGDYGSGRIWNIASNTTPTLTVTSSDGFASGRGISSFAQDIAGELYLTDVNNGNLYQLTAQSSGGGVATQLSATGCAVAASPVQPTAGMIPYAPNAGFWSDGADKSRWLAVPNGTTLDTSASDGDWNLPNGTVLRKDFRLGTRLVETRLFMRHTNGNWAGYTYEWNAGGTDATRVVGGKDVVIGGQTWVFPSEAQCLVCHTQAAGRSLGLETAQLNGSITYPPTGRTANQLYTLNHVSMLNPPIVVGAATPRLPNPYDTTTGTAAERARAWLHTNCSFCHRPGGTAPGNMDLRYATAFAQTNTCNAVPQSGDLGLANARIVSPGNPGSSVLLERIERRDAVQMPPLASTRVDDAGVQLITSWIQAMSGC